MTKVIYIATLMLILFQMDMWRCLFLSTASPCSKKDTAATLFVPVYQPAGLRLASSDRSRWKEKLPVVEMLLCVSLIKMGLIVWELVHALWRSHGRTTWSNTEFHVFVSLLCRTLENCKWCFLNLNKWQWLRFRLFNHILFIFRSKTAWTCCVYIELPNKTAKIILVLENSNVYKRPS